MAGVILTLGGIKALLVHIVGKHTLEDNPQNAELQTLIKGKTVVRFNTLILILKQIVDGIEKTLSREDGSIKAGKRMSSLSPGSAGNANTTTESLFKAMVTCGHNHRFN